MKHLARSPEQIGNLIRSYRRERQLTQKQLADLLGTRQDTISRLEAGRSDARLSTLLDVLAALDLELTIAPRSKGNTADIAALF